MKRSNRKCILFCILFLIAGISGFSQTDSINKKPSFIPAGSRLQKKIPAYFPSSYALIRLPYDSIKEGPIFFGTIPYAQKINLYNTYLPEKKWSSAFTAAGQVFLSAFSQNNNQVYAYPKK